MSTETDQYAICLDCDAQFANREEMYQHQKETLAPAEPGVHRGHRSRVVNPTPEEIEERRIRRIIDSAVEDGMSETFEDLDRQIRRGSITEEDVTTGLRNYSDFSDGWDEWRQDAEPFTEVSR